jgi:hypothetical protein
MGPRWGGRLSGDGLSGDRLSSAQAVGRGVDPVMDHDVDRRIGWDPMGGAGRRPVTQGWVAIAVGF